MVSQEIRENWTFRKKGDQPWLKACVPGCVHMDLLFNNLIPDPFIGLNAKEIQWIEQEDWEYHCVFNVSSYLINHDSLEIWFHGIDTYADIFLNGKIILHAYNMFHPWSAEVKGLLHEGENTLALCFFSPYKTGLEKYRKLNYQLPASNDKAEFKVSPFIRKSSYQFGWDWAPRLLTSGIWKNVELLAFNKLKIRDFYISQIDNSLSYASLLCELEIDVHSAGEYILAIYVDKDLISTGKNRLTEGINKLNIPFGIYNPKLWYPRGYGNPDVYKITIDIKYEDKVIDARQTTTGLRKIELINQNSDKKSGFHFKVNGLDVYAKGANIIPLDYFLPRVKTEDYKKLIENAVSVNMNMLRVWGGAAYESDSFYNLCNQEGIMVWQDFMFACMMYPSDNDFLATVREEIEFNIKRLRNHPSVILWCGNNEILEGFHLWGWKEELAKNSAEAFESYKRIFNEIIPKTLRVLDSSRPYLASSPSSLSLNGPGIPELQSGDFHYWDIIKKPLPLSSYEENVGRFMSEFGFKSYPETLTINQYAKEGDKDIHSDVLEFHQGWETGAELVERHITEWYGKPACFSDFLYFSQLMQKEAIKIAIEAHRRAKPYCMGSLFWQLNDCWPCASWSAIDYYGNWKALMYELRHLFADTIISPHIKNKQVQVFVVTDKNFTRNLRANLKLINFSGQQLFSKEIDFQPNIGSSEMIFSISLDRLNISDLINQIVLITEVYNENHLLDRNLLFFVKPSELILTQANPVCSYSVSVEKTTITLKSDFLLKNLFIENTEMVGQFSDNYFDLLPGEEKTVFFSSRSLPNSDLGFKFTSLNDLLIPGIPDNK